MRTTILGIPRLISIGYTYFRRLDACRFAVKVSCPLRAAAWLRQERAVVRGAMSRLWQRLGYGEIDVGLAPIGMAELIEEFCADANDELGGGTSEPDETLASDERLANLSAAHSSGMSEAQMHAKVCSLLGPAFMNASVLPRCTPARVCARMDGMRADHGARAAAAGERGA